MYVWLRLVVVFYVQIDNIVKHHLTLRLYIAYSLRSCLKASSVAYGFFVSGSMYRAGCPVTVHIIRLGSVGRRRKKE